MRAFGTETHRQFIIHRYIHDHSNPNDACPRLTGVPFLPSEPKKSADAKSFRKEKNVAASFERLEIPEKDGVEVCHCGCTLDDALWGFYLWKTGKIVAGDRVDNYRTDWIDPRQRKFLITRLKDHGVELENLWEYRLEETAGYQHYVPVSRAQRLRNHISVLQAMLEVLEGEEDEEEAKSDDKVSPGPASPTIV
ncbi:hypothetical protein PM082_013321 [Marasmius tenuissimus]|nr:hypothetical protein PM082_013321 [Marasmius tenuissimus]